MTWKGKQILEGVKMKKQHIEIREEKDKMLVDVRLPVRVLSREPVSDLTNSELIQYLKDQGIKMEDYELKEQTLPYLTNYSTKGTSAKLEGTWTFEKKTKKRVNKKKSQTYNNKQMGD